MLVGYTPPIGLVFFHGALVNRPAKSALRQRSIRFPSSPFPGPFSDPLHRAASFIPVASQFLSFHLFPVSPSYIHPGFFFSPLSRLLYGIGTHTQPRCQDEMEILHAPEHSIARLGSGVDAVGRHEGVNYRLFSLS
jgi:hypothetical protein